MLKLIKLWTLKVQAAGKTLAWLFLVDEISIYIVNECAEFGIAQFW